MSSVVHPESLQLAVVALAHKLVEHDLLGILASGNISVLSDEQFAITGSGVSMGDLDRDHVVVTRLAAWTPVRWLESKVKPSTELDLHLACLKMTGEQFCVHLHSPWVTAMSAIEAEYLPLVHYHQVLVGSAIPYAPFYVPGSKELAEATALEFRGADTYAVMMSNHGAVVVGNRAELVLKRCIILEDCCRILAHSISFLKTIPSNAANIRGVKELFRNYG